MNAASILGIGLVFTLKDEVSNAADKMTNKFKQLNYVSSETAAKMESSLKGIGTGFKLMGAGAAILAPFAMATQVAADFEAQMSNIKAVTGATNDQMLTYGDTIKKAGANTAFSAMESAQGFEALIKAGVATEKIVGTGLTDALNFATAAGLQVGDAADLAANALNGFKNDMLSLAQAGDIMVGAANVSATTVGELKFGLAAAGSVASQMGISFKDVNSTLALFAQNSIKGSDAGTSFKTFLTSLVPNSKNAQEEMEKLGLIINGKNMFFDAKGSLKGMGEISQILQDATKGLNTEKRIKFFKDVFGSDAIRAASVLSQSGMKGIADIQTQMEKITAKAIADEKLNNFNGAMTILKSNLETVAITVGTLFLPMLTKMANFATVLIQKFGQFSDTGFGQFIIKLIASIGVGLVAFGGLVSAFHAVKFAMMAVQPVLVMLKAAFASTLVPLLPYIAVGALVAGAIYGMVKAYQSFSDVLAGNTAPATGFLGFMQKIGGAIHAVIEIWKSATNEGFTLSGKLYEALQSVGLGEFALNIGTWIVRIKSFFGGMSERFENLKNVFGSVGEAFGRVGQAFNPIFDLLAKAGFSFGKLGGDVSLFSTLGGYAFDYITLSIRYVATTLELLANGFVYIIDNVAIFANFFINTFSSIRNYIDMFKNDMISLPELFTLIGTTIVTNLHTAFQSQWQSFKNLVVNSIKALPGGEAIAGFFGIGGSSGEEQAKQAAVAQTGLAGQAKSDTTVSPTQANSSFTQKMDTINNASVVKAQQGRQTAQAMETLASSGVNNSTTQVAPIINVNVVAEMDGENIVKKVNSTNQLNDARG